MTRYVIATGIGLGCATVAFALAVGSAPAENGSTVPGAHFTADGRADLPGRL